jgi:hypothetical protein
MIPIALPENGFCGVDNLYAGLRASICCTPLSCGGRYHIRLEGMRHGKDRRRHGGRKRLWTGNHAGTERGMRLEALLQTLCPGSPGYDSPGGGVAEWLKAAVC